MKAECQKCHKEFEQAYEQDCLCTKCRLLKIIREGLEDHPEVTDHEVICLAEDIENTFHLRKQDKGFCYKKVDEFPPVKTVEECVAHALRQAIEDVEPF